MEQYPNIDFSVFNTSTIEPLEFNDCLSTIEKLIKMQNTLNELINYINDYDTRAKSYTDTKFAICKQEIENLQKETFDSITHLSDVTDMKLQAMTERINNIHNSIVNEVDTKMQKNNAEQSEYLNAQLEEFKQEISTSQNVQSPMSGQIVPLATALTELYNLMRVGISAGDFDKMGKTAQQLDAKGFTAYAFDILAISW